MTKTARSKTTRWRCCANPRRLDRIEGTQAEHSASLAQQGATLAGHSATLAQHSQTLAEHGVLLDALVKAVTAIDANQQKQTEILKEHSKKLDGLTDLGRNHGAWLNATDGRLGLIEGRVGLVPV